MRFSWEIKRFSKRFSTSCRIFCTRIVVLLTSYTNLNIKDVLTGHIVYHKKKIQKYLATIPTRRQEVSLSQTIKSLEMILFHWRNCKYFTIHFAHIMLAVWLQFNPKLNIEYLYYQFNLRENSSYANCHGRKICISRGPLYFF